MMVFVQNFECLFLKIYQKRSNIIYYWFGYNLYVAVEFYGTNGRIDDSNVFYHGLSTYMTFDAFSVFFSHTNFSNTFT